MADFRWSSRREVGHADIDEQHRRLFLLAEAVADPLVNSTAHDPGTAQLQALIDFAQEHFAFEEGLMRSAGYAGARRHAKYHASLLSELTAYCGKLRQGRNTNPAGLVEFLLNWLLLHIDSEDRKLVAWLNSQGSGSVA